VDKSEGRGTKGGTPSSAVDSGGCADESEGSAIVSRGCTIDSGSGRVDLRVCVIDSGSGVFDSGGTVEVVNSRGKTSTGA
jgi:hypothetical protein